MKFNHIVIHDGVLYYAGQEVPIESQTPKVEKPAESIDKVEIVLDGEKVAEKVIEPKKATKKK